MGEPTSGRTVAAVDCGTNTIKLLIARLPGMTDVVRESRVVRLGQDLDRTGRISEEALERAFAAVDEYAALVAEHDVDEIRFCATSATRDAGNAEAFTRGVRERLGIEPEVVTGAEEAALAFDGAVRNLREPVPGAVLVIDVGGGSTELVLGPSDGPSGGRGPTGHSMDMGSVRLHERHLRSDPPTAEEVARCVDDIDAHLDASPVEPADARTVVAVAGSNLTIVAGVLDLPEYDPEEIDQSEVGVTDVLAMVDRLVAMTVAERRALPYMHPGRADVIDAGALILARVLRRAGVTSLVASESDILDGIAWSLA